MSNHRPIDASNLGSKQSGMLYSIHSGTGNPVILIHGLAASLYDWNDLIPELCETGFSVYALDLPGHGKSEPPELPIEYNIDYVFSQFCDWIENLNLDCSVILIGHSLGAYLAIRYAALFPYKVMSLILCDPFYSQKQLPLLLRLNYKYSIFDVGTIDLFPKWLIRLIIDITSLSIRNGFQLPENVRDQTAMDYKRAQPGIFKIVPTILDISSLFHQIFQPVFIIWGSQDGTLEPKNFPNMVKEFPNARGYAISNAGHVPHQSHSSEFNEQVLKFLNNFPS